MDIKIVYIILLFTFTFLGSLQGKSQTVDSSNKGIVKGIIYDSTNQRPLAAATVAIYRIKDSGLISYTLSNQKGEFSFENLPVNKLLNIIVSFIGYKTVQKKFKIVPSSKIPNMHFNLNEFSDNLDDVTVESSLPPVRMNGDTLEFNADAFKLDPNAQTEDLLRILPGVTIWADGLITVNGKEVHSLLVNGKSFFGNDFRVATQNIPKDIIEKVQVYQRKEDHSEHIKDSSTEINIQLKKSKDLGYFGKLSAGYANGKKYDLNASTNYFNKNTQIGIGYINNNINKVAHSMTHILVNNTFKSTKANTDYQSNFRTMGLNRNISGGVILQHNFIPKIDINNIDRFNSEVFVSNNNEKVQNKSQTITSLGDGSQLYQHDANESKNESVSKHAFAQYEKKENGLDLVVHGDYSKANSKRKQKGHLNIRDENNKVLSSNKTSNTSNNNINNVGINISIKRSEKKQKNSSLLSNYKISYHFENSNTKEEQNYSSNYKAIIDTPIEQNIARTYKNKMSNQTHNLAMSIPNIIPYIFSDGTLKNFRVGIRNNLEMSTSKESNVVKDIDQLSGKYIPNTYLTNNKNQTEIDIKPSLIISKKLLNESTLRYSKYASWEISLGPDIYILKSHSQKTFQELSKNYKKLVGHFVLNYENTYTGSFSNKLTLRIANSYKFPSIEQLAPLVDSANPNFIRIGSPLLKEQNSRNIELSFIHSTLKDKNDFSYDLTLSGGDIIHYITYNNLIDSIGRTVSNLINANGYKQGSLTSSIRKSFKMKDSQIQFKLSASSSTAKTPIYLNDTINYFKSNSTLIKPILSFEYKDILVTNLSYEYTHNSYKNAEVKDNKFYNSQRKAEISLGINLTKKISIRSNVIYTKNTFDKSDVTKFTIWNISAAYRLFKKNNAEIRFSALDLLNQNTGITNYSSINTITQGQSSVLHRYFMATFAWYPRRFGR